MQQTRRNVLTRTAADPKMKMEERISKAHGKLAMSDRQVEAAEKDLDMALHHM